MLNIRFVNKICKDTQLNDETILFLTIQFSISYKVKWFQVLLCIKNDSIKQQLFVKWWNSSISNKSIKHKSTKLNGSKYCYV